MTLIKAEAPENTVMRKTNGDQGSFQLAVVAGLVFSFPFTIWYYNVGSFIVEGWTESVFGICSVAHCYRGLSTAIEALFFFLLVFTSFLFVFNSLIEFFRSK
jgi:hypothetical protein